MDFGSWVWCVMVVVLWWVMVVMVGHGGFALSPSHGVMVGNGGFFLFPMVVVLVDFFF